MMDAVSDDGRKMRGRRRRELITFAVLAFGIWPVVAVGVVGGYGFLVWMYQIVNGPPGPHEITPAPPNSAE
jgi:nitrate reductase NapE